MDRRFPVVDFNPARFSPFFGNDTTELRATLLTGGACNSNYLVETPKGGKFVCRIHQRGDPLVEKGIFENLGGIVPVPDFLWVSPGLSVIEYIQGDHFSPSVKLVREAGRIIGRLRKVSFARSGQFSSTGEVKDFEGWGSFKEGALSLLHSAAAAPYLAESMVLDLEGLLNQNEEILRSFADCHNLVHGDFRPENILVSGDRIVGVIDWEFAHSGCSYMDIGNLLRHLPAEWESHLAAGLEEEGFKLPDDWRFRASLIDLASHLEFLTSDRSDAFKRECVERIHDLINQAS